MAVRLGQLVLAVSLVACGPNTDSQSPLYEPTRADPTPIVQAGDECWAKTYVYSMDGDERTRIYDSCMRKHGWKVDLARTGEARRKCFEEMKSVQTLREEFGPGSTVGELKKEGVSPEAAEHSPFSKELARQQLRFQDCQDALEVLGRSAPQGEERVQLEEKIRGP